MTSNWVKSILPVAGVALLLAATLPAEAAKKHKPKARATVHTAKVVPAGSHRGTNLFPAGPLYNGPDYLGDDPDPFIRFQIYRDLGARYGGDSN